MEFEQYYRVLGLEVGASLDEINQAYRDLAFIWHPDRIPKDNPRLLEKAVAKLQEINHARDRLRSLDVTPPSTRSAPSRHAKTPSTQHHHSPYSSYHPHHREETHHHHQRSHVHPAQHHSSSDDPHRHHTSAHYSPHRPYYRDLTGADFRGANLKEKDFSGQILIQANLSYANLSDSFLHKVNLEQANLFRANLFRANLLEANLRLANLQEANLIGADLSGADLSGANLTGAKVAVGNRIMVKLTSVILTGTTLPDGTVHA